MELVAPAGPVYQAGTLSGNPLAMTAGIETLRDARRARRVGADRARAASGSSPGSATRRPRPESPRQPTQAGTMFGLFFADIADPELGGREAAPTPSASRAFHRAMLDRGVYLAPSQFEAWFLSTAHGDDEIDATIVRGTRRRSRLTRLTSLRLRAGEGAPRHALLPARGRRRRAAAAEARAVPALRSASRPTCSRPTTRSGCTGIPTCASRRRPGFTASATSGRGRGSRPRSSPWPRGSGALLLQAQVTARRLLLPDASVTWNLTAIPAAIRIVRREGIDAVLTTSPPGSIHLVGAAVKQATGVRWLADLRDPLVANQHRRADTAATRARQAANEQLGPPRRPPSRCDLVRLGGDRRRGARARAARHRPHHLERMRLRRLRRARVPSRAALPDHSRGQLLREARPAALPAGALKDSGVDAVARFVGDFRSSDREWARVAWSGRPARADPLCAPRRVAPAPARLRGAAAARPERRRTRQGSAVRKGVRVPRGRAGRSSPSCPLTAPLPSSSARRERESWSRPTTWRGSVRRCASSTRASSTAACPRSSSPTTIASASLAPGRAEETADLLREIV